MSLPHRLIIDGVEQCVSDDKKEFLRWAYQYLSDLVEIEIRGKHGYFDRSFHFFINENGNLFTDLEISSES